MIEYVESIWRCNEIRTNKGLKGDHSLFGDKSISHDPLFWKSCKGQKPGYYDILRGEDRAFYHQVFLDSEFCTPRWRGCDSDSGMRLSRSSSPDISPYYGQFEFIRLISRCTSRSEFCSDHGRRQSFQTTHGSCRDPTTSDGSWDCWSGDHLIAHLYMKKDHQLTHSLPFASSIGSSQNLLSFCRSTSLKVNRRLSRKEKTRDHTGIWFANLVERSRVGWKNHPHQRWN